MTRWPWLRWVDISTTKSRGSQPLLPSSPATFRNAQTTTWHHILKCWKSTKMREKHGKLKKTFKIGFDSEFLSLCLNDSECMSLCPAMPYSLPHRFTHCRHSADSQSPLLPKWTVVCRRHWTHSEVSVEEGPSEVNTWDIHISHNARCSKRESKPCDLKTCKCNAVKNSSRLHSELLPMKCTLIHTIHSKVVLTEWHGTEEFHVSCKDAWNMLYRTCWFCVALQYLCTCHGHEIICMYDIYIYRLYRLKHV